MSDELSNDPHSNGPTAFVRDGAIIVDLWYPYPDSEGIKHVQVGMNAVRATDGIRVSYDFDRDGWVIHQPWPVDVQVGENAYRVDEDWREVAFVRSWSMHKDGCECVYCETSR